jgi:hypothetical protein
MIRFHFKPHFSLKKSIQIVKAGQSKIDVEYRYSGIILRLNITLVTQFPWHIVFGMAFEERLHRDTRQDKKEI